MARARNIKPGFYKNEDLAECSVWARLIFPGLWMLADREGRLEDRPKRIKGELLPHDAVEIDPLLAELSRWNFIKRYQVDGVRYIQIVKFSEHQTPHVRESASTIPAPAETEQARDKALPRHDLGDEEYLPRSPDSLIPESLSTDSGFSDSLIPVENRLPPAAPEAAPKKSRAERPAVPTSETWSAYETAYEGRYGTKPVRNAMVNGQMANFVKRLGQDEAPAVAAWYLSHNNRYYVQVCHTVAAMVKDAEKLRTEWVRRRQVTAAEANQADKTQTNFNAFAPLIEAAREREAREANNA